MRCELHRDFRFEAAHQLPRVPDGHRCKRLHGHSYCVTVTVCGELDAELGWLIDFGDLDVAIRPIIDGLDHRLLNEIDGLENPTSELLAVWLWSRVAPALPGSIQLAAIAVSETPDSRCVYQGE